MAEFVELRRILCSCHAARRELECAPFHVGVAVHFERHVGAASEAHGRSLEVACGRIQVDGPHRAQVGRRGYGQAVACGVRVALAGHHFQVGLASFAQPSFAVGHKGQLGQCHAVYHGDGQASYARCVFHVEYGAVHGHAVGVRAVEHKHLFSGLDGGIHEVYHRAVVRVVAQAHVLDVDHDYVERIHDFFRGAAFFAVVERCDGHACRLVYAAADVLAGVGRAAESMFGREYRDYVYAAVEQHVERVAVAHHAGVVAEQGHAFAAKLRQILLCARCAHCHFLFRFSLCRSVCSGIAGVGSACRGHHGGCGRKCHI